jgi:Restriction endonuclease/Tetratricopeptide repeat
LAERGDAHERAGLYDRAAEDYGRLIDIEPGNAKAWNNSCWDRAVLGRLEEALADCNEALRLAPDDPATLDSRGFTYLKLGRFEQAIADYDRRWPIILAIRARFTAAVSPACGVKMRRPRRCRGELGFQPPIIKVQCKQTLSTIGGPAVQQLLGAIQSNEHGLFVTLGDYSSDAVRIERGKSNLRLIGRTDLVQLIFNNYEKFGPYFKALLPLKQSYTPSTSPADAFA